MSNHRGWPAIVTLLVVFCALYVGVLAFRVGPGGLPFDVVMGSGSSATVVPIAGQVLPAGIRAGDRIDIAASPVATRMALAVNHFADYSLPTGSTYSMVLAGPHAQAVTVTAVAGDLPDAATLGPWVVLAFVLQLMVIALIALWRGRDPAAVQMAAWVIWFLIGLTCSFGSARQTGAAGLAVALLGNAAFLLARIGFYRMIEVMVDPLLSRRARRGWRAVFMLLLVLCALVRFGGPAGLVLFGWAGLLRWPDGALFSAVYLVPLIMLAVNYAKAVDPLRLRLRWMLWSGGLFLAGITLFNSRLLGMPASLEVSNLLQALSVAGFLYAVLRHRMVDVSFVLNRALVYALTTGLVMGLFGLLESVIEHTALGDRASAVLELAVPLALGVMLNSLHKRIDGLIERLFFRRKHRDAKALQAFAHDCAFYSSESRLLDNFVEELMTRTAAAGMAVYLSGGDGIGSVRSRGEPPFPAQLDRDDPAWVRLQSLRAGVVLDDMNSSLPAHASIFPMMRRGRLLGAVAVMPAAGERFEPDEHALLAHVVHEVGAALQGLVAQRNEALIHALASEQLSLQEARQRARMLAGEVGVG